MVPTSRRVPHSGLSRNACLSSIALHQLNMMANLRQKSLTKDQYTTDIGVNAETSANVSNFGMNVTSHNKLHKELLLAHKRGHALNSRSELQQVLDRRKRVQSDQEEEGQTRTPLEDALLRRQQKQLEREKEHEEKVQEEAQFKEFVRVRQNLRKIHSAVHNKAASAN